MFMFIHTFPRQWSVGWAGSVNSFLQWRGILQLAASSWIVRPREDCRLEKQQGAVCLCLRDTSAWRELMSPPWCCSSQRSAVCWWWWFYHCLALLPLPWLNLSAWRLSSFHFIAGRSGNDFLNRISLKILECAEKVLSKLEFFLGCWWSECRLIFWAVIS